MRKIQHALATLHKKPMRLILVGLVMTGLSGCSTDISDLHQFVHDARTKQKPKLPPLPEIKPHETYVYADSNLRDPFAKFTVRSAPSVVAGTGSKKNGPKPIEGRAREVLESFPLDSLRMVGILETGNTRWALIKASDGTIHRVKTGNYMGQNHGKIMNVLEDKIELMEIVPDGLGDWRERPATMALAEDPKGGK
jgi:type IV pilus assembly protein PilP